MFWGLIMEPKRRYTQKVKHPFHISMAALDIFSADDEPTQLMLYFEERNYLLCTLQKGHTVQCPLSLNFEAGDEVVFATNGHSNIHLSGYLQEDYMNVEEGEEEEEEEEDNELALDTKNKKRKVVKNESQPPKKKSKLEKLLDQTYDSDDDDSFALPDSAEEEDSSVDDEEEEGDEEEEDDEVFDALEDKEESDEDVSSMSDDDDDEEEEEEVKPKQNGVVSKKQKKALKQAQQNEPRQSPKATNKTPKGEKTPKADKTPGKQQKADNAQKNKTPKGEKTPKGDKTPNQKEVKTPASPNQQGTPQRRTLEGGVVVQDLKVGDGQTVKSGKIIQVYYEGRLKQNNKVFDQNSKGSGFKFRLGKQEVIKGWDVGVVGMKTGGKRRIICPPNMAYGNKGSPPVIPPNSTLVFDVELKNIL